MLKITKGLKKKKKGKKSKKNKEEELFKPEELEAYRREHQQQSEAVPDSDQPAASGENDEWKKFQQLTAGVDNILKKTQGDLDRIKSTSFFQRVPTPSELKKAEEKEVAEAQKKEETEQQEQQENAVANIGVVQLSETESEDEGDEDDIFDTSFVDAVESGEVKLAYIPESPTIEEAGGDDPFDTSFAERAILGPAFNKKGKKLVPLGAAVEVLTGRVEQVSCVTRRPTARRPIKQQDLLLGSFDFDDNGNTTKTANTETVAVSVPETNRSLLDDDSLPLDDLPIDLSGASLYQAVTPLPTPNPIENSVDPTKQLIEEFDLINKTENTASVPQLVEDDDDDEFAQLAAESFAKKPTVSEVLPQVQTEEPTWDKFEVEFEQDEPVEEDPFDTTFAENILPGKAELKLIENEILNAEIADFPVNVEEKFADIIKSNVSIHITNPTGERESISSLDRIDESCLNSLQPIHRDLLGGSNTDLSNIGDDPILPNVPVVDDSFSDYSDPFDTSIVEQVAAPGQAELKFIEKEILGEVTIQRTLSDPDFNPRGEESEHDKQITRPDLLDVNSVKSVAFALPSPSSQPDLLASSGDEINKHNKPLTPYYVRENSIPEQAFDDDPIEDPFDTSFVSELAPGKAELKLLENEFIDQEPELKRSLSDEEFDPRAEEKQISPQQQQQQQQPSLKPVNLSLPLQEVLKPDLLAVEDNVSVKVLTPALENSNFEFEQSYSDPFDTSIASNILPGKAELKLLENELIHTQPQIKRNLTDPEFDPRNALDEEIPAPVKIQNLLDTEDEVTVKPLTPIDYQVSFEIGDDEIDPFDTSVADNLVPGRTELKLLESELI